MDVRASTEAKPRMLLQTNSYIVPRDKRMEHARLLRKFRQTLIRLGCDHFEVFEQVGQNWNSQDTTGRFVQLMRFRDRRHQLEVQAAERADPTAQALIREFCELVNFPYQQQEGLFAVGYYVGFMRTPPTTQLSAPAAEAPPQETPAEETAAVEMPVQEEVLAPDESSAPEELSPAAEVPTYEENPIQEEPFAETEQTIAVDLFGEQSETPNDEAPAITEEESQPVKESAEQFAESNGEHVQEESITEEPALQDLAAEDPELEALFSSEETPVTESPITGEAAELAHETGGNGEHHAGGNGDSLVPSNGDHHAEGNGNGDSSEPVETNEAPADEIAATAMDSVFGEQVPPVSEDDAFDIHSSGSTTGSGSEQLKGNY